MKKPSDCFATDGFYGIRTPLRWNGNRLPRGLEEMFAENRMPQMCGQACVWSIDGK